MKKTILIVDDEMGYAALLLYFLEEEGFYVLTAQCGNQALKILETVKIDLVLLDYKMPGMDGFELMDQISGNEALAEIPVFMISGCYDKNIVNMAIAKGVKYFIHKPLSLENLLQKIHNTLAVTEFVDL